MNSELLLTVLLTELFNCEQYLSHYLGLRFSEWQSNMGDYLNFVWQNKQAEKHKSREMKEG